MEDERFAELEARILDLEDKVNNQLIGGLKKAKDKYDDDIAYDDFKGKYGEQIGKIDEGMKRASANPEYDTVREFYDAIKTVDGYKDGSLDVATMIAEKIKELAYRYNIPIEVEVTEEVAEEPKEEVAEEESKEEDSKEETDSKEEPKEEPKSDDEVSEEDLPSDEKIDEIAKSVGL